MARTKPRAKRPRTSREPSESTALLGGSERASPAVSYTSSVTSHASSGHAADDVPASEIPSATDGDGETLDRGAILRIVLILLIAVFVFNADHSLVLATHPSIGSEFDALDWSSWLFTGFSLAGAATQAVFGKLGDIYGRKPVILFSYIGFAIGCLIVAVARSMLTVILGRVLSGSVGAGMTVLVSILISDLVPIRESGTWRSYVNIAATTGRSLGGPLGGWLADAVGWRWSFGCQVPMLIVATFLCWRTLPSDLGKRQGQTSDPDRDSGSDQGPNESGKLSRVDFLGASLLALFILLLLLPMELGGEELSWSHPLIPGLFAGAVVFLALFVYVEKKRAKEPILDLDLFKQRDVVICLLIIAFQSAAQLGMMFSVPLYFQVTQKVSNSVAGAHLFPSVFGNALGGVFCGYFIKRTGKYKWLIYISTISSSICYALLLTRWHGNTNWLESFYLLPGGFGMGMAYSVLFVATQASADPEHVSAAVSTLFLSNAIGVIVGVASTSATVKVVLRKSLDKKLFRLGLDAATRKEIISKAAANVEYTYKAKGEIGKAIVSSYVDGLLYGNGLSLIFVLIGFLLALGLKERRIGS
ncbi:major facilitator superfamily transporter [Fusarium avenaceum]|nr:major facilitator superfamily transporter [Fusarium avenaceum]